MRPPPMSRALERLLRLQRGDLPRGLLLFAYAIGSLGLRSLASHLEAWSGDPDPLLREAVRQARARLAGPGAGS